MDNKITLSFEDTKPIRDFEGFSLTAYPDPVTKGEPFTISYGLTGDWVKPGLVLTQAEADAKFMEYIQKFQKSLDSVVKVTLNKNEYIALLSLMWNIGPANFKASTLLKLLNNKDRKAASDQFLRWNRAGGKVIKGLTRRREAERVLFLTPIS